MKTKKISVGGKNIFIFDDVFTKVQQANFYSFLKNSHYMLIGGAGGNLENTNDFAMQSMFDEADVNSFGIFNMLPEDVKNCIQGKDVYRAYGLCINYTQRPHFHIDGSAEELTFLYYANTKWDADWGGETVFADDNLDDIEYTSMYKPGRIVIFDASIMHKPCTPATDVFRFTFVANLK